MKGLLDRAYRFLQFPPQLLDFLQRVGGLNPRACTWLSKCSTTELHTSLMAKFILLKDLFYSICVHVQEGARRDQRRFLDAPELDAQVVLSHLAWVLATRTLELSKSSKSS